MKFKKYAHNQTEQRIMYLVSNPNKSGVEVAKAWGVSPQTVYSFKNAHKKRIAQAMANMEQGTLDLTPAMEVKKAAKAVKPTKPTTPKTVRDLAAESGTDYAQPRHLVAIGELLDLEAKSLKTGAGRPYQVAEQLRRLADIVERRI